MEQYKEIIGSVVTGTVPNAPVDPYDIILN